MKDERRGILLMVLCSVLWSMAGVMFKFIPWHPMVIAGLRAFVAGLVVVGYLRVRRMRFVLNRHTLATGLAMCATCTLFVIGNKLTTAANAIVLQYTAPVFLLAYSALFFHKKLQRLDTLAVLFTLGGIALFFFDQLDAGHLAGNLISVAAGAAMGLMYIFMGEAKAQERFSSILLCEIFTSLLGLPFLLTTQPVFSPLPVTLIVILGIFQLALPYILFALAAETCPPLACSLVSALEPLLSPVWVLLFFGEKPGVFALLGGAVVIITITVWCLAGERAKTKATA